MDVLSPLRKLTSLELNSEHTRTNREVLRALYGLQDRKLESLTLSFNNVNYNRMISLGKSDFFYLSTICVKKLNLSGNAIGWISWEAIKSWTGRTCLEVLDISRNQLFTGRLLKYLVLFPSITHVNMAYMGDALMMRKRDIPFKMQIFFFLPGNLHYLNITYSPIFSPKQNVAYGRGNNLQVLDASYPTRQTSCSSGLVKGLVHLTELDMSSAQCSNPNPEMFTEMPNLSRLRARQCNLKISFDSNKPYLFSGLNLSVVYISSNDLNRLDIRVFEDQTNSLKTLILVRNAMERIPSEVFQRVSVLETLDLSHNLISTLGTSEYAELDALQLKRDKFRVNLFGNPLVCSCHNLVSISWIRRTRALYKKNSLSCITLDGSQMKIGIFLETFDDFKNSCVSQL
ncbi:Toll-like receptor 7 [Mizuhopecten yessoensis]|uniref:Toll-like receptor 7 n=1 Tax=Mizuhopecten yessoensis TaxID=6573 RepID=A0A210PV96_MIZYE|nr:Toll-like receptor 7 [Mizuhopecten yessoensis]